MASSAWVVSIYFSNSEQDTGPGVTFSESGLDRRVNSN